MPPPTAGLLLYRRAGGGDGVEVLIAHMGGPYWARRDAGAWSIPKGAAEDGEDPLAVALREFEEEIGFAPPDSPTLALGAFRQANRKVVTVFAREGDLDASAIRSNTFEIEYPPRSGRMATFPEIDRAAWVAPEVAREKLVRGQVPAIDALLEALAAG